jgi:hypothetical protein
MDACCQGLGEVWKVVLLYRMTMRVEGSRFG